MANSSEKLTQELTKNYQKVQKKELDYVDFKASAQKTFTNNTKKLNTELKKSTQNVIKEDKEVVKSFKQQLNDQIEQNSNFLSELKAKRKNETEKSDKSLEGLVEKFNIEESKVDESLSKINKEYAEKLTKLEKEYNSNIDRSTKHKEDVVKKADKEIVNLDNKYEKEAAKTEDKVKSLNLKKDEKIQKTKDSHQSKIEKVSEQLKAEEDKNKNWKEERHPVYLAELEIIEKEIQKEASTYEEKYSAIKSTMESRVARREKFVNRAQSEGDSKAVKAQSKEIKKIKGDAEKELKILQKSHFDDSRTLSNKRRDFMKSYLSEIADYDKKYLENREERHNKLELLAIELYKDIAEIDIDFRSKINTEIKKLNEFYEDNETKKSNILDEKERALLSDDNDIEQFGIVYEEEKLLAAILNDKEIALHNKAHDQNATDLEQNKELEKIELEKVLAKFDFDENVRGKRFDKDKKVLIEEEYIEHHQNEFKTQTAVSSEYKEFQDEFTNLYGTRAKELSEYEELETTNRYKLRIKFLEKELELVQKDADKAINKVNSRFDLEIENYQALIDEGSSGELEELLAYETEKKDIIQKEVEKRNTLNPKAYKKQIRDLDHKIDQMTKELSQEVDERKQELESTIQVFKDEIVHAEARKDIALSEVEGFLTGEVNRLNSAIELLNSQLDAELKDIANRKETTIEASKLFDSQSKIRREKVHEENENYMEHRNKVQRDNIHKFEYDFEAKRNEFDNAYQEVLELLKNNRDFKIDEANQKTNDINEEIKGIEEDALNKSQAASNERREKEQTLQENNVKNSGRLDVKNRNHLTSITNAMYEKNTALEQSNTKIEEDIHTTKSKHEQDTKQQAKNYDQALNKELEGVDARLRQELQTVL